SAWLCDVGNELLGLVRPDKEITFVIEEDQNAVAEVADVLEEAELIDHPMVFKFYCGLKHAEGTFQTGEYTINCQSDYNQIIRALQKKGGEKKSVKFTINPGDSQEDFVTLLCDSLKCYEREDLEEVLQEYDFSEYSFLSGLPDRNYRLEGYLYPGKYETYEGESAVAMIRHILDRFEEKVLTEENQKLITESGYSLDELVTLASILQMEGGTDLAKSAGVYFNRLGDESFPYLESQATVSYILPMREGKITASDLLTDDPYNTYLKEGLPPGAICSPGSKALAAVLEPKENDYLYFVTNSENKTLYAVEEAGHRANLKKGGEQPRGTGTIA
ncbi:MAG: endolytic transglycosylase MltG, partial [Clostridia bacterium]|nr:endolytic transglycosylase MltG [Clostridia bacterium]